MKTEVIDSILTDDLKEAGRIIARQLGGFELLADLFKKVKDKPVPLKPLKAQAPKLIGVLPSYTCEFRCKMCNSGFQDRSFLFDDYKYFLPEQYEKLSVWLNLASDITFVGLGETLNSPYIHYFLKKIVNKHSTIYTNGLLLNREKIQMLIDSNLNCLVLSFDGKLSMGHGNGEEKYIQTFWQKVQLIQKVKKDFNSKLPVVKLVVVVASENIDDLDNVIETALRYNVTQIMLSLMKPLNEKMYRKSIFADFDESKGRINSILSKWNKKGILVTVTAYAKRMRDSLKVCPFVDNWLHWHGRNNAPGVCCGSIEMPVYSDTSQMEHWNSFPFRYFRYLHFYADREGLPISCKNCWAINLKMYSQKCSSSFNGSKNKERAASDHIILYNSASELKQNNLNSRAEELFLEVLKLKTDPELKGKAYFHLGEIQLRGKNYKQALRLMKLSVQYCFNHARAFAYLYLLMMLFGEKKIQRQRRKFRIKVPQ